MSDKSTYSIIGLMSGTSVDGLDIAHVLFQNQETNFEIKQAKTVEYPKNLREKLKNSAQLSGEELTLLDVEFGSFCAKAVNNFLLKNKINSTDIDLIASHGHTVFHQPQNKMTLQIGCGQTIATNTGILTINDFRTKDVVSGGQGAPLVPIGDHTLLKGLADSYLNLGGFSNISFKKEQIIAFDICPVGVLLNKLMAEHFDLEYDKNGNLGKSCGSNSDVFNELNDIDFYHQSGPKSLGIESLNKFWTILEKESSPERKLGTIYHHIAFQIAKTLKENNLKSVFISGGGAKNNYLIELLASIHKGDIIIPEEKMIDYKEAFIFAYLGLLKHVGKTNILKEVTGAKTDSSSGVIFYP